MSSSTVVVVVVVVVAVVGVVGIGGVVVVAIVVVVVCRGGESERIERALKSRPANLSVLQSGLNFVL